MNKEKREALNEMNELILNGGKMTKDREQVKKIQDHARMIANNCNSLLDHPIRGLEREVIREWGEKLQRLTRALRV